MIAFVLSSLILLYGINEYNKKRKDKGFLVFFFFLSNGFHLISDSWYGALPISKSVDFALLYLIYVFFANASNRMFFKSFFQNYKWLQILFCYISINFLITVLLGDEQIGYSIKVFRVYFPLLSVLLIQELSSEELQLLIKKIVQIVFITVLLHISQFFTGIQTLQHTQIEMNDLNGFVRYRNIPYFAYFLLIYFTIKLDLNNYRSIAGLLFCVASLLMSQHRGPMIGYVFVVVLYLLLVKQMKKVFLFLLIGIAVLIVSGDFLIKRFESENTGNDIQTVLSMNAKTSYAQYDRSEMGNFTFRILLLEERIEYLMKDPILFIRGVGLRHEDSPLTKKDFSFSLGTGKPNSKGFWEPAQIISVDLAWQTPLMLFGFLGLLLFVKFTVLNIKFLFKYRNISSLAMASFLYYIFLVAISFKNDHLFGMQQICFMLMVIEYLRKKDQQGIQNENIDFDIFKRI